MIFSSFNECVVSEDYLNNADKFKSQWNSVTNKCLNIINCCYVMWRSFRKWWRSRFLHTIHDHDHVQKIFFKTWAIIENKCTEELLVSRMVTFPLKTLISPSFWISCFELLNLHDHIFSFFSHFHFWTVTTLRQKVFDLKHKLWL